jgi:hypothetical protein
MPRRVSRGGDENVCGLVCEIVNRNRRIGAIRLCIYKQGKLPFVAAKVKLAAKELRLSLRQHGFWQSVLTICWRDDSARSALQRAIRHAAEHVEGAGLVRTLDVPRGKVNVATFTRLIDLLRPDEALAIMSKVRLTNGRWAHLPMVDFACYDTDADLKKVLTALRALGHQSGAIVRSGNSFHFYCFQVMSEEEWLTSMARFLLLAPIVDVRYTAHRIIDRVCVLRLSGRGGSDEPVIAARL